MDALLIVVTLGVFLFGYVMVKRFDTFVDSGGIPYSPEVREKKGILIHGSPDAVRAAKKHNVLYAELKNAEFPKDGCCFSTALFLSDNEADNLRLCREARAYDPDVYIIVKCLDMRMKEVYYDCGASYIVSPEESADKLLAEIRRAIQ